MPFEELENSIAYKEWQARSKTEEWKALARKSSDNSDIIELRTECFYWITSRCRTIVRLLPHMKLFEAVGIRNVRNKLIEHAEKDDSQVMICSFSWGGEQGPVVKGPRFDHQKEIFPDPGLYINAKDFYEKITEQSIAAIQKLEKEKPQAS